MVFYIVINGVLPKTRNVLTPRGYQQLLGKAEQWAGRGYISVNGIAQTNERLLMTEMWRILYKNIHMNHLIICFQSWNSNVDNLLRYCLGHGITVHLYDLSNGDTQVAQPINNLPRSEGYDMQGPRRRCPDCGIVYRLSSTVKACPQCHIIYDAPTPLLNTIHERMSEIGSTYQLRNTRGRTRMITRQLRRENQAEMFQQMQAAEEQLNMGACVKALNTELNMPVILDRMQRWARPYLFIAERDGRFIDIPLVDPLTDNKTLEDFARGWAWLYELATPNNLLSTFITSCQILCYINEGIKPSRSLREEPDQGKIEHLHGSNFADLLDFDEAIELGNSFGVDIRRYRPII
jgi:hypothetical protein